MAYTSLYTGLHKYHFVLKWHNTITDFEKVEPYGPTYTHALDCNIFQYNLIEYIYTHVNLVISNF